MKNLYSLFIISLLLSCSSGKKALEKGKYEDAVLQSIQRLRNNPDSKRAQQTLLDAYPRFVEYYQDRLVRVRNSTDPLKWERTLGWYEILNDIYEEVQRSPAAMDLITNPISFEDDYYQAKQNASEARYSLGKQAYSRAPEDRESAKEAYRHFEKADGITRGFRDAEELMEEARQLATTIVGIEPIPMHTPSLEVSNDFFQDQVAEYISEREISPFVEFYSTGELHEYAIRADQIIRMRFDEFYLGQAVIREIIEDRTKDSIVIGTVDVLENDSTVTKDVIGTVKAKVFLFEKEIISSGILDFEIIDIETDGIIRHKKFSGTHSWIDHWGYFNGDERALDKQDKKKLKNNREIMPPPPQVLFEEFTRPIYDQLVRYIRDHYRKY